MKPLEWFNTNSWIKSKQHLIYAGILAALLAYSHPSNAKTSIITDETRDNIKQVISSDFTDNILQKTWTKLPAWYEEKVRNLVKQNNLLEDEDIAKTTEDFIANRVKKNPGINEENWCLFIVNLCLEYLLDQDIYSWEDWDAGRTQEFISVAPKLTSALDEYIKIIEQRVVTLIYMKMTNLVNFYESYKENPEKINQKDFEKSRQSLEKLISWCKKYGVDPWKKLSTVKDFYVPYL